MHKKNPKKQKLNQFMKFFFRSFLLISLTLLGNGCNKKIIIPDKNLQISNSNEIKFPIDLEKHQEDFLYALFKTNTLESKELLRQYLFDKSPSLANLSLKLLDSLEDKPTSVERYVLKNPSLSKEKIELFLSNIKDQDELRKIIFHTLTKVYRPEINKVDLYSSQKRIGFNDYSYEHYFSYKDGSGSGGRKGILEADKLSLKKEIVSSWDSGWHTATALKKEEKSNEQVFFKNMPVKGAWTKFVPNTSCPPACSSGLYFMGDGNGYLICGDLESGKNIWKAPFPIPPYAQILANGKSVSVKFECDIENFLIAQFSASNGFLLGLSIEKKIQRPMPSLGEKKYEISFQYKDQAYLMTSKSTENINWEQKIFCKPIQFWKSGDMGFLLGKWSDHYFALGAFDIKTGKPLWCQAIQCGEHIKLHFQDEKYLWLMDEDSVVMCIEKNNGKTILNVRFSESHYSLPVTGMAWDQWTDRILIDPSNGAIYSFPKQDLIKLLGFKSPKDETLSFAHAFQMDVVVQKINKSFKSIPEITPNNTIVEEDGREILFQSRIRLDDILFSEFANTFDESKFGKLETRGWFQNWDIYEKKLIKKAKDQELDFQSLEECFLKIKPRPDAKIAFIPVNAFECIVEEKPSWVIVCKWENNMTSEDEKVSYSLSHVRIWAITKKEKEIIGFSTCN